MENKQPKIFSCHCCNATFNTKSNMLLKHNRTAKHLKIIAKLEAEPTENIQIRNTNSELEKEIEELELQLKNKDDIINNIVHGVNKLATKPSLMF